MFRFVNLVHYVDTNLLWKHVKILRNNFMRKYFDHKGSGYTCSYLVSNDLIKNHSITLMQLLNVSTLSPEILNLSKAVIKDGAEMFLYLNTCPQNDEKESLYWHYHEILKTKLTSSGIFLYLLNSVKSSSLDGRKIAIQILEKFSSLMKLRYLRPNTAMSILDADMKEKLLPPISIYIV